MSGLGTPALLAIFLAAAWATWVAGVNLAKATDLLDDRYGLGEALGGMILLSVAGSLPELAITLSAAVSGDLGLAAGNLIGGVAMQTLVLVIADRFVRGSRPLSTAAGSLIPALEGAISSPSRLARAVRHDLSQPRWSLEPPLAPPRGPAVAVDPFSSSR
jgi:cation:H+ antiporter